MRARSQSLAEAKDALEVELTANFLKPLQVAAGCARRACPPRCGSSSARARPPACAGLQNKDLARCSTIARSETRRLDYDFKRRKFQKTPNDPQLEEQVRIAENKFEESKDTAWNQMATILENDTSRCVCGRSRRESDTRMNARAVALAPPSRAGQPTSRPCAGTAGILPECRGCLQRGKRRGVLWRRCRLSHARHGAFRRRALGAAQQQSAGCHGQPHVDHVHQARGRRSRYARRRTVGAALGARVLTEPPPVLHPRGARSERSVPLSQPVARRSMRLMQWPARAIQHRRRDMTRTRSRAAAEAAAAAAARPCRRDAGRALRAASWQRRARAVRL